MLLSTGLISMIVRYIIYCYLNYIESSVKIILVVIYIHFNKELYVSCLLKHLMAGYIMIDGGRSSTF